MSSPTYVKNASYIVYNGKNVLTYESARHRFNTLNPHKIPAKEAEKPSVNRWNLFIIAFILIAVNILSGGHTIPMITKFYDASINPLILSLIAVSGFLAIEGTMVALMAQPTRSKLAYTAIFFAFMSALSANLYKTYEVFTEGNTEITLVIGVIVLIFGIFAPVANLVIGEVLHNMQLEYQGSKKRNIQNHLESVSSYVRDVQAYYKSYLSRIGIKDAEIQELFIAGMIEELLSNQKIEALQEQVEEKVKQVNNSTSATPAVAKVVEHWLQNNVDPNAFSLRELADTHDYSTATISNARKLYNSTRQ